MNLPPEFGLQGRSCALLAPTAMLYWGVLQMSEMSNPWD
jgi:hypothetical protein